LYMKAVLKLEILIVFLIGSKKTYSGGNIWGKNVHAALKYIFPAIEKSMQFMGRQDR